MAQAVIGLFVINLYMFRPLLAIIYIYVYINTKITRRKDKCKHKILSLQEDLIITLNFMFAIILPPNDVCV
jgi:hypothetical protein